MTVLFFLLCGFCLIVAVVGLFNPRLVTAGKIKTRAGAFLAYLGAAFVSLFAVIVLISNDPAFQAKQSQREAAVEAAPQAESAPVPTASVALPTTQTPNAMPDLEAQFIAINRAAQRAYRTAENEVAAGAVRRDRATAVCRLMEMMEVRDWHGKIVKMSSTGSGDGRVEIEIAEDVRLGSTASEDVIDAQSYAGRALAMMKVGDLVVFDGMFHRDDTDCLYERSLTQKGSVTEPEYKFHFTDFRPASVLD